MLSIQKNVNLQNYTTMALRAYASHFTQLDSVAQLPAAVQFARNNDLKIIVLGEGSNSLFIEDQQALVLNICFKEKRIISQNEQSALLYAAAGENWDQFVQFSIEQGLYGIENLSLIPGTVGAAPIQNIGAYGVELEQSVAWVDIVNLTTLKTERLVHRDCQFSYRGSIFKRQLKDQVIIVGVAFNLSKRKHFNIQYAALKDYLNAAAEHELCLQTVRDAVIAIRNSKLPNPKFLPNAGSFFKNPVVDVAQYQKLKRQYPNLPAYLQDENHYKLAAAWLIEQAGWKGKKYQRVAVHDQQALVLINHAQAAGVDLMQLAADIQTAVQRQYSVALEIEPCIYP